MKTTTQDTKDYITSAMILIKFNIRKLKFIGFMIACHNCSHGIDNLLITVRSDTNLKCKKLLVYTSVGDQIEKTTGASNQEGVFQ